MAIRRFIIRILIFAGLCVSIFNLTLPKETHPKGVSTERAIEKINPIEPSPGVITNFLLETTISLPSFRILDNALYSLLDQKPQGFIRNNFLQPNKAGWVKTTHKCSLEIINLQLLI